MERYTPSDRVSASIGWIIDDPYVEADARESKAITSRGYVIETHLRNEAKKHAGNGGVGKMV